jgi:hypothetical protein
MCVLLCISTFKQFFFCGWMSKLADLCRIDTLENDVVCSVGCVASLGTYLDFSDSGSFAIDDGWSSRLECWVTLESRFRRQAKRKTWRRGETKHIIVRCGFPKTLFDRLHLFCPFYSMWRVVWSAGRLVHTHKIGFFCTCYISPNF